MAIATKTLDLKEEIIDAAAQTVLAPFKINASFYNDIIKKVKNFSKQFSKTEQSKILKENISGVLTDIIKAALPTEFNSVTGLSFLKQDTSKLPDFVNEKVEPVTDQFTSKTPSTTKPFDQISFFDSLKSVFLDTLNIKQKPEKPKEQKYFTQVQPVLLQDIAPEVYTKLTDIIQNIIPKDSKPKKEEKEGLKQKFSEEGLLGLLPKGLLPILGGAGLILGGLAALVGAFATQGPMKGALELIGKVGLKGGLTMLAKKLFTKSLEKVLGKIPIIGSLITFGFAIQRFMNGDTVGGLLGIASGIANLFPGVGTVISLGIDVLQAVLDAKAGGSSAEASAKKSGILFEWAKGLGSLLWKGIKYLPVIGPLFDAVDSYQKGDWSEFTLNLLRSVGQMSGVFYVIDLIDSLTGGNLKNMAKEGVSIAGNWLAKMGSWLYESAKSWPVIGRLIKIGEAISNNNWAEALTQFSRIIPGMGWLYDFLGFTEEEQTQAFQDTGNIIKDLWTWMSETMWEKVTGWMSKLTDGVKDWWNNLSWDPRSWVGATPEIPKDQKAPQSTVTVNGKTMTLDEYEAWNAQQKAVTPMATGGIVTQPTNALVGEAGPEAIIPLDRYMDPTNGFDNSIFEKIASNTGSTNDGLKSLAQAIFKLAQIYEKNNKNTNNIVVNGQKQQERVASASEIAASNRDPIRQVRMQFAI
jgi:hypothetical protein